MESENIHTFQAWTEEEEQQQQPQTKGQCSGLSNDRQSFGQSIATTRYHAHATWTEGKTYRLDLHLHPGFLDVFCRESL